VCFCISYGASDEWHQSFVPGRDADLLDLLADTTGGLLAISFIYFVNKKQIKYLTIWFR
jgi:VanZ family protein